jgi:hypothetical protein
MSVVQLYHGDCVENKAGRAGDRCEMELQPGVTVHVFENDNVLNVCLCEKKSSSICFATAACKQLTVNPTIIEFITVAGLFFSMKEPDRHPALLTYQGRMSSIVTGKIMVGQLSCSNSEERGNREGIITFYCSLCVSGNLAPSFTFPNPMFQYASNQYGRRTNGIYTKDPQQKGTVLALPYRLLL